MTGRRRIVFALVLASASAAPAHACRVASARAPLLHETFDPQATADFAAEVEIVPDKAPGSEDRVIEARIIKVLHGTYAGAKVVLRLSPVISSCDGDPGVGQRGIVIGKILSTSPEELVLEPYRALSENQRQRLKAQ